MVALLGMTMLVSCGEETPETGSGNYIAGNNVIPDIVYTDEVPIENVNSIYQAVKKMTGEIPIYGDDGGEPTEHEIVIGSSSRAISQKALRKLRTVSRTNEYSSAFVIYVSGGSVAIVFDDDIDDLAQNHAIEYFIDNYMTGKDSIRLNPGVLYSGEINALDYYAEIDEAKKAAQWQALEQYVSEACGDPSYGKAFVAAYRDLYTVYDAGMVSWLANLYEPFNCHCGECTPDEIACYGGGFYYSNSARDNAGFYPDIESTAQAAGMLSGLGLGSGSASILSETAKTQIIKFLRECQDKNGFFYHPQWTKEDTDAHTSRRARDTSNAASLIQTLGGTLKYKTPTGVSGEAGTNNIAPLGVSTPSYAAKVVVAAAGHATHLEDLETYKQYLVGKVI